MLNRRDFFKSTAAIAFGSGISSTLISCSGNKLDAFGLQLYSVKELMQKDPKDTLKQLASFGYKQIESFGGASGMCFGMKPAEFRSYLQDLNLTPVSSHFGLNDPLEATIDVAKTVGMQYLVVPYIPDELQGKADNYKKVAEQLNQMGEVCQKAGLGFGYHNHAFEFKEVDGQLPYDILLKNTDPKLVKMEMDIYWVVAGGHDPIQYIGQYPGRFEMCHIKDMGKTGKKDSTEVGNGSIDFVPILQKAEKAGMKYYFVEQEYFTKPHLQSMKESAQYLAKIKY